MLSRTLIALSLFTVSLFTVSLFTVSTSAQEPDQSPGRPGLSRNRNNPGEVEKFRDREFGLFLHWSVDGPLGGVISHSLVGGSADFTDRFFATLPGYFNPDRLRARKVGGSRQAGRVRIRYVHDQASCRLLYVGHGHDGFRRHAHTVQKRRDPANLLTRSENRASPSGFTSLRMISIGCTATASPSTAA